METSITSGLTTIEVTERKKRFGRNEIVEYITPVFGRILKTNWPDSSNDRGGSLLSGILGKVEEFTIIAILLLVNIGVDFLQEEKAGRALAELKATLAHTAIVRRDGVFTKIDSRDLVPGDIVKLTIGSIVPADVVLRSGDSLEVDQSALTGESLSVTKVVGDLVYGNAIIRNPGKCWLRLKYGGYYIHRS